MRILITNDDGIHAVGILSLVNKLKEKHEVIVVAPDKENSGSSSSITFDKPLLAKRPHTADYDGVQAYMVNGTPVDCVKMGICVLAKEPIDLVIAGINLGSNIGTDLFYSGTLNAAAEANLYGYPSIALSQYICKKLTNEEYAKHFAKAASYTADLLDSIDFSKEKGKLYNINFPLSEANEPKGIKVCELGKRYFDISANPHIDDYERHFHWMIGRDDDTGYNEKNMTDIYWIDKEYITITPIKREYTEKSRLDETKCKFEELKLHF